MPNFGLGCSFSLNGSCWASMLYSNFLQTRMWKTIHTIPFSQGHTFLQLFPILWPYRCITVRWYCIMEHTPIPPREDLLKSCCTRRKNCGNLQLEVCPSLGGVKQSRYWPHLEAINILLYNSLSDRWDWIKNLSLVLKADSKIVQLDWWE